jgi:penicillin amidase
MARWWSNLIEPRVTGGASYRQVIEPGNWDAARGINMPGQSGEPQTPHFADLVPLWLANRTIPLAYAPAHYNALTESALHIEPRG